MKHLFTVTALLLAALAAAPAASSGTDVGSMMSPEKVTGLQRPGVMFNHDGGYFWQWFPAKLMTAEGAAEILAVYQETPVTHLMFCTGSCFPTRASDSPR